MKTKVIFMLMCAFVLALTIGCSGGSEAKSDGPIEIEWWTWDPEMKDRNVEIIAQFEAQNPGVTIINTVNDPQDYWPKIRILANQGKLPDVFTMSSGYIEEWAAADLLLNLDSLIENDDTLEVFYKSLFDAGRDISGGEHYYAIPFALVTSVMFYNKDLFDEAGVPYPADDWTWDDFLAAAKALTKDTNADGKIDQWGHWFYGRYSHIEPWIYANGGSLINRDTMRFDPDQNAIDTMKMLTDLVLVEGVAPSQKEMSALRQQDVFPQQVSAMWMDGSWNIDNTRTIADPSMNWGIARAPQGPNGTNKVTFGWPDYYALAPNTENPEMAWKFARFVAGEGLTMAEFMPGKIPSYIELAESDDFVDETKQPAEMGLLIEQAAGEMKTSYTLGWSEWRGYGAAETLGLNGIVDAVINGEMTFDEALADGTESINTVFERYYK